jgi:hypothetical protein
MGMHWKMQSSCDDREALGDLFYLDQAEYELRASRIVFLVL